jgi:hypothetical protein
MSKQEREKSRRDAWLLTRAHGKTRFVLIAGTAWGFLFVAGTNLARVFLQHKPVDWSILPISLCVAVVSGCGLALWNWSSNEKKYPPPSATGQGR